MPNTYTSASPSAEDIMTAIGMATDGDTVIVGNPAHLSVVTWDEAVTITNKNITLQFPGTSSLAVKGGNPGPGAATGQMLIWTLHDVAFPARLTGMRFWQTIDQGTNGKGTLLCNGFTHLATGGGLRIDNCYFNSDPTARWKADCVVTQGSPIVTSNTFNFTSSDIGLYFAIPGKFPVGTTVIGVNSSTSITVSNNATASGTAQRAGLGAPVGNGEYILVLAGFIEGVMDHCTVDYPVTFSGSEIFDISHNGDANDPQNPVQSKGELSWSLPYVYGGNPATNSQAFFFEDNKIHYRGLWCDSIKGGGRQVIRYNTTWGAISGHGTDTGGNFGNRAKEIYNNVIAVPDGYSISFGAYVCRGGGVVACNNYITNIGKSFGLNLYRMAGTSTYLGPADGTNYLDNNQQGNFTLNGINYVAVHTPADSRIGSTYATGTNAITAGQPVRTYKLNGTNTAGSATNQWAGFVLRNGTTSPSPPDGDGGFTGSTQYGFIISSTAADGSGNITVTIAQAVGSSVSFAATDTWELRYVANYFAQPGAGQLQQVNNSNIAYRLNNGFVNSIAFKELDTSYNLISGTNPRWLGQEAIGMWQKNNHSRANSTAQFSVDPGWQATAVNIAVTPNGINDNAIPGTYPTNTTNPKRAGADADFPGYSEIIPVITDPSVGYTYPHPLISGAPPASYIAASIPAFGNVIVGNSTTQTLIIANNGNADLHVSGVTYPTGFTGANFSGTITAGTSHNVTVTFSPVSAITYTGNISITSDAGNGSPTLVAVNGIGVPAALNATRASFALVE